MSDQSSISITDNLEFLRKEAKSLLKRCRMRDAAALHRMRAELPRMARLDDEGAASEIKLADVQHALARERGYASWGELKLDHGPRIPAADYSRPGHDGALPDGFTAWRWCLSYTVGPEILSTLVPGQEYRICVSVLRKVESAEKFAGYAQLYERANDIANARAARLRCPGAGQILHKRILTQGWFRHAGTDLVRAFLTIGVTCLKAQAEKPVGQTDPAIEDFVAPGGMTPENHADTLTQVHKHPHELYSDGDVRNAPDPTGILLVSYGEYVKTSNGIDYEPFVRRAEQLAKFHLSFLTEPGARGSGKNDLKIVRREWFCATNPDIAVVHVFVQT